MRTLLVSLAITLALGGCGGGSDSAKAAGKSRLFDGQRDALDRAKGVNESISQTDTSRRAQEDSQSR